MYSLGGIIFMHQTSRFQCLTGLSTTKVTSSDEQEVGTKTSLMPRMF